MNDQQMWDQGLQSIENLLADLPAVRLQQLSELLVAYRQAKESMAALILQIDSETICTVCAGQCCVNGKYRINVLDLISQLAADISMLPNFEQKPFCPYGTIRGCLMEPRFRPADCIVFICDALDDRLSDVARTELSTRETTLRSYLVQATDLLDLPVSTPLLLWAKEMVL